MGEPAEKLFFRMVEVIERPKAVGALREKLDKIEQLMQKWETTHPQVTDEERADVLSKVEDVKNTLLEKEEAQAAADPSEDPVFTSAEVPLLTKDIQALLSKLSKRPKPKPKVEKKNETESDAKANSTESTEKEGEEKSTEEGEEKSTEEGEEKSTEDDAVDESKAEDNVDGDAQNDEVISEEEQKAEDEL